jgi:hypothetical protein
MQVITYTPEFLSSVADKTQNHSSKSLALERILEAAESSGSDAIAPL